MAKEIKKYNPKYSLQFDFPENFLVQWNASPMPVGRPRFAIPSFSKEDEKLLLAYVDELESNLAEHFMLHFIQKKSYTDIGEICKESPYMAKVTLAKIDRILSSIITKNWSRFASLHWKYDVLYEYDFTEKLPPVMTVWQVVHEGNGFTIVNEETGAETHIREKSLGVCENGQLWLPEADMEKALALFKEKLESDIRQMEERLPIMKAKLQQIEDYSAAVGVDGPSIEV